MSKRKFKECPSGYICKLCDKPGHWVFDCPKFVPKEKNNAKKKAKNGGEHLEGSEPSPADISAAKELQAKMNVNANAPKCFCKLPAKMRKCKRSKDPRAMGVMFWWCGKDRWDGDTCRFARRVDQEKGVRVCRFWRQRGSCKKGDDCEFFHEMGAAAQQQNQDASRRSSSDVNE